MVLFVFRIFIVFLPTFWSRSSMDRIVDSGSIDWSSSLHGITVIFLKSVAFLMVATLFALYNNLILTLICIAR